MLEPAVFLTLPVLSVLPALRSAVPMPPALTYRLPEPDSEAQTVAQLSERQPEALQIELPASVPDIPVGAVRRFSPLPAASASAVPSSPAI